MRKAQAASVVLLLVAGVAPAGADILDVQSGGIPVGPSQVEEAQLHLTTNNGTWTLVDINNLLSATRFYGAGYSGAGVRQANIEAGHVGNTHSSLQHHSVRFTGTGAVGSVSDHATQVGHAMGGRDQLEPSSQTIVRKGISPQGDLWSGAIATSFGGGGSFTTSNASVASTYSAILKNGFPASGGQTAHVFNSSWGFFNTSNRDYFGSGRDLHVVGVDGFVNATGVVSVFSAGNDGSTGSNSVGGIGAGYNSITVGALGSDTSSPVYNNWSTFSSYGPSSFWNPQTATYVPAASSQRATVDISAPGQNLALAVHGAGNEDFYWTNSAGTSFSAPIVAGGAALIVDAGLDLYGTTQAIDGRTVKAVLLNGAHKTTGWTNGQTNVGGVVTTTQSLDYQRGAGRMDLNKTFDNYVHTSAGGMAGTTDVAGLSSGDLGNITAVGWDFGQVQFAPGSDANRYFISAPLGGSTTFTATLTWFADRFSGADADFTGAAEQHLADLDLRIFEFDNTTNRNILGYIAQSISAYNVVEHLSFTLPADGFYGIEVDYFGSHWNVTSQTSEFYGLAWNSTAIPEPAAVLFVGAGAVLLLLRRRSA